MNSACPQPGACKPCQPPCLVETSRMLFADKGKLGKLQLLVISLMLPWGLPHGDWICQETGQISSLRLKGDHVALPPFSMQHQLEEVPQGRVQAGFEYLKVWTFCSKPQPCQEEHSNLLLEPDAPARCVPSPTLLEAVPKLAGIPAAQVPVVHGQPLPCLHESPPSLPALTWSQHLSLCHFPGVAS